MLHRRGVGARGRHDPADVAKDACDAPGEGEGWGCSVGARALSGRHCKKPTHVGSVADEAAIAEPYADRFHSFPQTGYAKRVPRRRPQTYEPPLLPAEHIRQAGTSERGWLLRLSLKGQQYTSDCEPIDRAPL